MGRLGWILAIGIGSGAVLAGGIPARADPCNCKEYEKFVPQLSLAAQIGVIGVEAAHDYAHPFYQSEEARQALRTAILSSADIPEACKKKFVAQKRWDFYLRGVWDINHPLATIDTSTGTNILSEYKTSFAFGAGSLISQNSLAALTPDHRAAVLALNDAQGANDDKSFFDRLGKYRGLSFAQRMLILKGISQQLQYQYDYSGAPGSVIDARSSPTQMFAAFKNNLSIGYQGEAGNSQAIHAGVCRQEALFGARAAEALGMGAPVMIAYGLAGKDAHQTFAIMDPSTRTIHIFNEGIVTSVQGREGSAGIFQQMGDRSMAYLLQRPSDASTVVVENTQMQQFLAQVSGFDPANSGNPLSRPMGTLIAPTFRSRAIGMDLESRMFYGQDGNGAGYVGVSQSAQGTVFTPLLPFKAGLTLFSQNRPQDVYAASTYPAHYTSTLDGIYGQIEQRLLTPELKLPVLALRARIEAMATGLLAITRARDGLPAGTVNMEPELNTRGGVRLSQGQVQDRFQAVYFAGVSVFPFAGLQNSAYGAPQAKPVLNDVIFTAQGRANLCPDGQLSDPGCAYLFAHAIVLADYFGLRGQGEAGIALDALAASLGFRGRFTDDMPAYREGSNRAIFGTLKAMPVRTDDTRVEIGVQGIHSVDTGLQDTTVQGTVRIEH